MANLSSERELEDYLFNLGQTGEDFPLSCYGKVFRQVSFPAYGIADLLYIDIEPGPTPTVRITIVELKTNEIDLNAVGQICRYRKALSQYINHLFIKHPKHTLNIEIEGILVGRQYSSGDVCYVIDSVDWLRCYHYNLSLHDGIDFEESGGWYRGDESFEPLNNIAAEFVSEYLFQYKEGRRYLRK